MIIYNPMQFDFLTSNTLDERKKIFELAFGIKTIGYDNFIKNIISPISIIICVIVVSKIDMIAGDIISIYIAESNYPVLYFVVRDIFSAILAVLILILLYIIAMNTIVRFFLKRETQRYNKIHNPHKSD